jgi:hypothetical protein
MTQTDQDMAALRALLEVTPEKVGKNVKDINL